MFFAAERTVFTVSPPSSLKIDLSPAVQPVLSLSAEATSDETTAVSTQWYRDDRRLFADDKRIFVVAEKFIVEGVKVVRTNLTIYNLTDDEFGEYQCRATNGISTAVTTTRVNRFSKSSTDCTHRVVGF